MDERNNSSILLMAIGICKQISVHILYKAFSKFVTLLKSTCYSAKCLVLLFFLVACFKHINSVLQANFPFEICNNEIIISPPVRVMSNAMIKPDAGVCEQKKNLERCCTNWNEPNSHILLF